MNPTSPAELQNFLYNQIPLARALGIVVNKADDFSAEVFTPLQPNLNHLGTAFGGSLGAVLILAGYTWLYQAMISRGLNCHVLIRRSETDYRQPVDQDFTAIAYGPTDLARFLETFDKKGVARLSISAEITNADPLKSGPACLFTGEFVAQKRAD